MVNTHSIRSGQKVQCDLFLGLLIVRANAQIGLLYTHLFCRFFAVFGDPFWWNWLLLSPLLLFPSALALNRWLFFGIVVVVVVGKICDAICVFLIFIFHVVNITTNHTFNVHSHFYWTNYWQLFIKPNHIKICFVLCSVVVFFFRVCVFVLRLLLFHMGHCGSFSLYAKRVEDYSIEYRVCKCQRKIYFVNTFTHNM